jgi:hypothetical protein
MEQAHAMANMDPVLHLLPACRFAFDWDDNGFSYSKAVAKKNLSSSQSNEYHHPDLHSYKCGKYGSKQHTWEMLKTGLIYHVYAKGRNKKK